MNIYLARNEDISESFLIKLLDLLKSLTGSFKFRHIAEPIKLGQGDFFEWKEVEDFFISDYEEDFLAMNQEINMSLKKRTEYFTWEVIFKEIFRFRSKYIEKDSDLIFLFTAREIVQIGRVLVILICEIFMFRLVTGKTFLMTKI